MGEPMNTQHKGMILAMWVPCVVFAHLLAAFFLLRTFAILYPKAWADFTRKFLRRKQGKQLSPSSASRNVVLDLGEVQRKQKGKSQDVGLVRHYTQHRKLLHLEWKDLGCRYSTDQGPKVVLKSVTGYVDPGEMIALMGPSGAGKSTLMDILAGRKSVGHLTGEVLVNGAPQDKKRFTRQTAYIPQEDNFLPTMSVAETCTYYASLVLPSSVSKAGRAERISQVLAALGLSQTTHTLVGGYLPGGLPLRGLSGGERKRLSIATGIMSTPSIVFLDEPTSGLDSFAALKVMGHLRTISHMGGPSIVASIHQPRAAIWAMFDKALLLSLGRLMFFGPRDQVVPWFKNLGYNYDPAMHGVPSDWIMDLVNINFDRPEAYYGRMFNTKAELDAASEQFIAYYSQELAAGQGKGWSRQGSHRSPLTEVQEGEEHGGDVVNSRAGGGARDQRKQQQQVGKNREVDMRDLEAGRFTPDQVDRFYDAVEQVDAAQQQRQQQLSPSAAGRHSRRAEAGPEMASWFGQLRVLFWREILAITRNPADVAGRMLIFTWISIFLGLIYFDLGNNIADLRSRMNVLFIQPVIFLLLPYVYMSLYTSDKQYFIADVSAKLYSPSAYYVAKQLAILPFAILNVLVFSYTLYGMAGLRYNVMAAVGNGILSTLLYLIAAQVLSFAAIVAPNQDIAFMLAIGWTAVNLLMSNFLVRYVDMRHHWLSYLRYLSAMGYTFAGLLQLEFSGLTVSCAGGLAPGVVKILPKFLPTVANLKLPFVTNQLKNPGADCSIDLSLVVQYFQVTYPFWLVVTILVGYWLVTHLLTFAGLLYLAKKERR